MKAHTQTFKDNLTTLGKEINAKVTYTIDGAETELDGDTLGSVTPHYEGNILKSVMKQIDIVSDVDIPIGTIINVQFGMRYNTDEYEYIDYGNYVVNKSEKQEDTNNYKIIAYDKMLYAMKDYEELDITYPITIRDYINAICTKIGLTFANADDTFANYDKEITQDLYKDLGYTYRDILTELAQVTASTICINKDDELEVRYINQAIAESEQLSGTSFDLESDDAPLGIDEFDGETTQETTILPSGYTQVEYIESTGEQYIDTNFKPNQDTRVVLDFQNLSTSDSWIFGSIINYGTNNYSVLSWASARLRTDYNNMGIDINATINRNTRYTLDKNKNVTTLYSSGTQVDQVTHNASTFDTGLNMFLFSCNNSGTVNTKAKIRLYGCQVYNNGTMVRDFIPCYRNNDSVIGLYDLINDVFYINVGTGTFVKGASIPNPNNPQEINVVEGLQQDKLTNKNLCSMNNTNPVGCFGLGNYSATSSIDYENRILTITPNSSVTSSVKGVYWRLNTDYYVEKIANKDTTISFYIKADNDCVIGAGVEGVNHKYFDVTTEYQRISFKFNRPLSSWQAFIFYERNNTDAKFYIKDIQVELGDITDFEPYNSKIYEINLGKNMLDISNLNISTIGTISYAKGNNYLDLTTTTEWSGVYISKTLEKGNYYFKSYITIQDSQSNPNGIGSVVIFKGSDTSGTRIINQDANVNYSNKINKFFFTIDEKGIYTIYFRGSNASTNRKVKIENIILSKSDTEYSPYFEPIFLGKINDYKDFIRKGNGKNLFDKNAISIGFLNEYGVIYNDTSYRTSDFIPIQPSTIYCKTQTLSPRTKFYNVDKQPLNTTTYQDISIGGNAGSFTTPNNAYYLKFSFPVSGSNVVNIDTIMLEKGSQQTEFEPYGFKDKWYLYKAIGKYNMVDISNDIKNVTYYMNNFNSTNGYMSFRLPKINFDDYNLPQNRSIISSGYCNALKGVNAEIWNKLDYLYRFSYTDGLIFTILYTDIGLESWTTSSRNFKTELDNYLGYVDFYLPLKTPTITEITSDNYPELYNQLKAIEKARTFDGVTYIDSTTPINIDYIKQLETFNEDYIKNTRADFGEKYGPINSVVLSRSAESDNIYLKDQDSIDENGLCEVKIKDNQIMNDNNRDQYLPDLLEYLKQVEYYINDFESIGITYLDLLDRYKVVIGDKSYYCVMLNDEVGIHDGLNEIIYTEKPKEEVTEYKKASTTDKQARQTYLMVDKQAQRIDALVSDEKENFSRIQVEIDSISSQVQSTNVELDSLGNEIDVVRSSISEQTSEAITDWFNTALKPTIEDLENSVDSNDQTLNEIKSYVRRGVITDPQSPYYNQAFVELGDTTNQTTLRILPNRIQFLTNGQETAFISNNQLYINESTILTKEKIGNWVTTQDENGLLNTYWED